MTFTEAIDSAVSSLPTSTAKDAELSAEFERLATSTLSVQRVSPESVRVGRTTYTFRSGRIEATGSAPNFWMKVAVPGLVARAQLSVLL